MSLTHPSLGFGLGLRSDHYIDIIEQQPEVDWFEIISENFMIPGGKPFHYLDQIRQNYPIVMHGVSMSIGSSDPLNWEYLNSLKTLIHKVEPKWVSDHLCWTGIAHQNMHDLLPLPYTEESIRHVVERIKQVQEFLGRRLVIENVSSYVTYTQSSMSEWEFLTEIAQQSDCLILLDINNIYVSAFNHHFDPVKYLNGIPIDRVQQFHLAGHSNMGEYIIDTHDAAVIPPVWELYAKAVKRFGLVSTMIERDDHIPPFKPLFAELNQAKEIASQYSQPAMAIPEVV